MKSLPSFSSRFRLALRSAALGLALVATQNAVAAPGNPLLPRGLALGRQARGEEAVTRLGANLPGVARAYGLRSDELADLFRRERGLWADKEGSLLYLCEGLPVAAGGATSPAGTAGATSTAVVAAATPASLALHSTPGASRVIYLDFTGHTTAGTSWNSSFTGGATISSQPFDLDGDPTTFNEAECAFIFRVWQRVAEDFAPFSVDVTTEDPGVEALRYSGSGDTTYGQRVVVTPSNWYSSNAGGVSYIGSFNWSSDTPNFVFTQQLANGEKYIAEAISHETGHSLGLNHEGLGGSSPTEYYAGQGDWAPIMGNSYYRPITQWCKGEYQYANNPQNQLSVMLSYGLSLITNTYGNSLTTATLVGGPTINLGGTIASQSDVDVFRFNTGSGAVSLEVSNLTPEPNMNIQFQLLNATGALLQIGTPSARRVVINASLAEGTYYLKISGTGNGDPYTTGYSNYGSVGNYVLSGSLAPTGGNQAPVAVITASTTSGAAPLPISFSSAGSFDGDGNIVSYSWSFGDGSHSTEANPSHTYAAAGNYSVTLTVVDNGNLNGTATVAINVSVPANQLPVSSASGAPTNGAAPLPVSFSSSGSWDPDGSIAAYRWDFGDGTSSTLPSPTKTYSTPGNYTARLTVTDNQGATHSSTVAVSATTPIVVANADFDVDVQQYVLTINSAPSGKSATAKIVVRDRLGRPAAGVTVNLRWSGLVSGSASARTDANGQALITSGRSKKTGSATGTITAVSAPSGSVYDVGIYAEPIVRTITLN